MMVALATAASAMTKGSMTKPCPKPMPIMTTMM
jgi:hypothetical protein